MDRNDWKKDNSWRMRLSRLGSRPHARIVSTTKSIRRTGSLPSSWSGAGTTVVNVRELEEQLARQDTMPTITLDPLLALGRTSHASGTVLVQVWKRARRYSVC